MVEWKKQYSNNDLPTVGRGYWANFMKRRGHEICSKRGEKYELDQAQWTTYANFKDMYKHIYMEMEDAGVATKRESAV